MEVETGPSSAVMTGAGLDNLLLPLSHASARKLPHALIITEDAAAAHRCAKAFAAVSVRSQSDGWPVTACAMHWIACASDTAAVRQPMRHPHSGHQLAFSA